MEGLQKYKIVLLGDQKVGKTSIMQRFVSNNFNEEYKPTVGIDFMSKSIQKQNKVTKIQIWDCAGQQRFRSLVPSYVRDSQGILIVFDVTNKSSFLNVRNWLKFIDGQCSVALVGNKTDLQSQRQVSTQEASNFANQIGIKYIQASAKQHKNISECINSLISHTSYQSPPSNQKINEMGQYKQQQIQKQNNQINQIKIDKQKQQQSEYSDFQNIGLSQKALNILKENEINTIQILLLATESDLSEIGIPLGDRIKIRSMKK